MYQVVVLPPPGSLGAVERFRKRHDPAFHRVGAHLPVLPAFEARGDGVVREFAGLRGGAPFGIAYGSPAVRGRMLCLPITDGATALRGLRDALAAVFLDPLHSMPEAEPHLRVGLFASEPELELTRRALVNSQPPEPFEAQELVLLMEDARGLWHEIGRRRFVVAD